MAIRILGPVAALAQRPYSKQQQAAMVHIRLLVIAVFHGLTNGLDTEEACALAVRSSVNQVAAKTAWIDADQNGYCTKATGDPGTVIRSNVIEFESPHPIDFRLVRYVVSDGQPVAQKCLERFPDGHNFKFYCGTKGTSAVRDLFKEGLKQSNWLVISGSPTDIGEMNFAFEVDATFHFDTSSQSLVLRLGQQESGNIWVLGSPICARHGGTLQCGDLSLVAYQGSTHNHTVSVAKDLF